MSQVLDFNHLIKLLDTTFHTPCMLTMQPVSERKGDGPYALGLHACVRPAAEDFLCQTFTQRVRVRFEMDWQERLIDKDMALTTARQPHLQVGHSRPLC